MALVRFRWAVRVLVGSLPTLADWLPSGRAGQRLGFNSDPTAVPFRDVTDFHPATRRDGGVPRR